MSYVDETSVAWPPIVVKTTVVTCETMTCTDVEEPLELSPDPPSLVVPPDPESPPPCPGLGLVSLPGLDSVWVAV